MNESNNYPKIVYKYRNWVDDNHKNMLLKNQLYMSSPKDFNDPFDCRIPKNFKLIDTQQKIEDYASFLAKKHKHTLASKNIDFNDGKSIIIGQLSDIDEYQKTHEEISFKQQDIDFGVLCLSGRWNSLLMWSHYANCHKGYCIGFIEEKLRKSKLFGMGGSVMYNDDNNYPQIDPFDEGMEKRFKATYTKSNEWSYEQEYRLANFMFDENLIPKNRLITIPDNFIAEITIGLMAVEEDRQEIIANAKQRGIKVYQTKKSPFKFELVREEI